MQMMSDSELKVLATPFGGGVDNSNGLGAGRRASVDTAIVYGEEGLHEFLGDHSGGFLKRNGAGNCS